MMGKKLLFLLLLALSCLFLVYSQDTSLAKQEIVNDLLSIKTQLLDLDIKLQNSKTQIVSLQKVIADLKEQLKNSADSLKTLNYELEKQKQLLAESKAGFLKLQTTYNELLDQSEALSRKLSRLEKQNKWLWIGVGVTTLAALVFGISLFAK